MPKDERKTQASALTVNEAARAARLDEFKVMASQLKGKTLSIGAKAGTSGKIFGSVTAIQLSQQLKEQFSMDIERKLIILPEEIKNVGSYVAIANLHKEVQAEIAFEVVAE